MPEHELTEAPPADPKRVDYRALREQVKKRRQGRRAVKHPICLDTALYEQWAELSDQDRQERVDRIGRDPEKPDPTARHGDSSTEDRLKALEERIHAVSLVGVFLAPTPEQQAERNAGWDEVRESEDKAAIYNHALASAKQVIVESFDRFLDHAGNAIPAEQYGLEDLKDLMEDWTQGQLFGLSSQINGKSTEVPEIPLSVRQSLLPQR